MRVARKGLIARKEQRAAYLFLSPWLIGLALFWVIPILASVLLSMSEWNIITPPHWLGAQNYREMLFEDRTFWVSIRVTLKYMLLSVPLTELLPHLGIPALTAPFVLATWIVLALGCLDGVLFREAPSTA